MNVHPADLPSENGDKELKRPAPKGLSVNAELVFDVRHGKTFLARQLTPHPFHITRPFYFEEVPQGIASLYLQSSSGGLYGDDHLTLDIAVRKNAAAHVTTQASTVVHAARGGVTRNRVRIHVERGAFLEFLPDPVILFSQARLQGSVEIELAEDSTVILADAFLNHDPDAIGAGFERYDNSVSANIEGRQEPFFVDRMEIAGTEWPPSGPAFAAEFICHGALYVFSQVHHEETAAAIRARLQELERAAPDRSYSAVEALPEKNAVCVRMLARDGARLHTLLTETAISARTSVTGTGPARRPK
ncbi:MAG: urease accessory protein UreD [Pseudomonadota bacterium]